MLRHFKLVNHICLVSKEDLTLKIKLFFVLDPHPCQSRVCLCDLDILGGFSTTRAPYAISFPPLRSSSVHFDGATEPECIADFQIEKGVH